MNTIPLSTLIRAAAALKAAKDTPVAEPIKHSLWVELLHSGSELQAHIDRLLKNVTAEVTV